MIIETNPDRRLFQLPLPFDEAERLRDKLYFWRTVAILLALFSLGLVVALALAYAKGP